MQCQTQLEFQCNAEDCHYDYDAKLCAGLRLADCADSNGTTRPSAPESTYRLQFHKGFTFQDATAIVPYLHDLGITHVYASPYLKAAAGSTHGYDVIDHKTLNPELGTNTDFNAFLETLRAHGMSHILDTVPNHAGVATNDNAWWNDVLMHGQASVYARYFDIAWQGSPRPELHEKLLLPLLGDAYATVLEQGKLKLVFEQDGSFSVQYFERRFPINPRTIPSIIDLPSETRSEELRELENILSAARDLPATSECDEAKRRERRDQSKVIHTRLADLAKKSPGVQNLIAESLATLNGHTADPRSFDRLDALLNQQAYRLTCWRNASDEINYRRFFDINDLAALNMQHEDVFLATHDLLLRLLTDDKIGGLRIDHPDGLFDPRNIFNACSFTTCCGAQKNRGDRSAILGNRLVAHRAGAEGKNTDAVGGCAALG